MVIAVGVVTYLNRAPSSGAGLVQEVERSRRPVQITVVEPASLTESLEHTGVLEAYRDVVLTAEVAGKVQKIHKDLGDICENNETLIQLDPESYRIALQQAVAALKQARSQRDQADRELQRTEQLSKRSVVTAVDLERAQSGANTSQALVEQAKAAASMARRNLRQTAIRCPFDGNVAQRMVEVGQLVGPQSPLARIVDTRQLKLTVTVSAAELSRLRVGQKVTLTDPALDELRYDGEVARLGVAADPVTRTFPVEVVVAGGPDGPKPGQVVRAFVELAVHERALAVPADALVTDGPAPCVFVARNGTAARVTVVAGPRIDSQVIIRQGLQAGDQVIVVGQHGLMPGTPIAVQHQEGAASAAAATASPPATTTPTTP
jgi:RND family efflux transporter MFP subunit